MKENTLSKEIIELNIKKIKKRPWVYLDLDDNLKNNKQIILATLENHGALIEEVPKEHWDDLDIIYTAVKNCHAVFSLLDEKTRRDLHLIDIAIQDGEMLKYVPHDLITKELIIKALSTYGMALTFHPEYMDNKDLALLAVKQNPFILRLFSEKFKNDYDLVFAAVEKDGLMLNYASDKLKKDPKIVKTAVAQNGLALTFANEIFQIDKEYSLIAIKSNDEAIEAMPNVIKDDPEIMMIAIKQNISNIKYLREKSPLYENKEIAYELLPKYPSFLEHFSKDIRGDKALILDLIKIDPTLLFNADPKLKNDVEVVTTALLLKPSIINSLKINYFTKEVLEIIKEDKKFMDYILEEVKKDVNINLNKEIREVFNKIVILNREEHKNKLIASLSEKENVKRVKSKI